jgi:predicted house-cleaning noncanonical NTP pyrophosphatase (MazG superfamily)
MKATLLSALFIFVLLAACKNNKGQENQQPEIPKALEDKGSFSSITKREYNNNVVEDLYNELVEKTPELKTLENQIDNLNNGRNDSAEIFNTYNGKNTLYYAEASQTVGLIKDSLIKEKIRELIANSNTKYSAKISEHAKLLAAIDTKLSTLEDLHTYLKVKRTFPIMEKYQSDNLPSTKPINAYNRQVDATLILIDTLVKK